MKIFKLTLRHGKRSSSWYGKVRLASGRWQRVRLFSDKVASERQLVKQQAEQDQRTSGMRTAGEISAETVYWVASPAGMR